MLTLESKSKYDSSEDHWWEDTAQTSGFKDMFLYHIMYTYALDPDSVGFLLQPVILLLSGP